MKDFNIAKYLKEHSLGSHGILGKYVDLNPLKEEEDYGNNKPVDEVPYTGADTKLDGFGDEFDQVDPVSEADEQDKHDRMMGMVDNTLLSQLPKIKKAVDSARERGLRDMAIFTMLKSNSLVGPTVQSLVDDGFGAQDIVDFFGTDFTDDYEPGFEDDGMPKVSSDTSRGLEEDDSSFFGPSIKKSRLGILSDYYRSAEPTVKHVAKELDEILAVLIQDKSRLEELTDLIIALADAYGEEKVDNYRSDMSTM